MVHPEIQTDQGIEPLAETLDPVYPQPTAAQRSLRKFVAQALSQVQSKQLLDELLPEALSEHYQLPPLMDSLWRVHHPNPAEAARFEDSPHRARLVLEELIGHWLALLERKVLRKQSPARACPVNVPLLTQFCAGLPYSLPRLKAEFVRDTGRFGKAEPMHRLVQGDVGAGKTLVAAMAALPVLVAATRWPSWHPPKS